MNRRPNTPLGAIASLALALLPGTAHAQLAQANNAGLVSLSQVPAS